VHRFHAARSSRFSISTNYPSPVRPRARRHPPGVVKDRSPSHCCFEAHATAPANRLVGYRYQEPHKIRWREVLNAPACRLVVPLRVVEELDGKKYSASGKLARRARALLPLLEQLVGDDGSPGLIEHDVTN
jgi:hypothetical protein